MLEASSIVTPCVYQTLRFGEGGLSVKSYVQADKAKCRDNVQLWMPQATEANPSNLFPEMMTFEGSLPVLWGPVFRLEFWP